MENRNIEEFERVVLDPDKTGGIKYSIDFIIESKVKYEYLCEKYIKENVDSKMSLLGVSLSGLADIEKFSKVIEALSNQ